ncbi:hypothetical protein ACFWGN_14825 [Oerskovia sp. NPDC060338]|uniref:hypothetical protein n=1 Tax=Oerskovia sp. NPDC060338 TaxID=3347100 RepID=UPI0036493A69
MKRMWPAAFYVATGGRRGRRRRLLLGPFTEKSLAECALPFVRDLADHLMGVQSSFDELHVTKVAAPRGLARMAGGEWNAEAVRAYDMTRDLNSVRQG